MSESLVFDDEGIATDTESLSSVTTSSRPTNVQIMQQNLHDKDNRILALEAELAKVC